MVGSAVQLSWAGDQTIAMYWVSAAAGSPQTGVRLLDTSAPGGDLPSREALIAW